MEREKSQDALTQNDESISYNDAANKSYTRLQQKNFTNRVEYLYQRALV